MVRRVGQMSEDIGNGCGDNLAFDGDDELPDEWYFGGGGYFVENLFDRHRQSSHRGCVIEPEPLEDNED